MMFTCLGSRGGGCVWKPVTRSSDLILPLLVGSLAVLLSTTSSNLSSGVRNGAVLAHSPCMVAGWVQSPFLGTSLAIKAGWMGRWMTE